MLSTVSTQTFKEFYTWRRRKDIKNHTLHKDVVLIREVLKHALNNELLDHLPHVPPLKSTLTRRGLRNLNGTDSTAFPLDAFKDAPNVRVRLEREDLHDFMVFWRTA